MKNNYAMLVSYGVKCANAEPKEALNLDDRKLLTRLVFLETGSRTLPPEVRYFRANHDHQWKGYKNYKVIDHVYFGYFEEEIYH
jgi:hypothetical protein